MVYTQQGRHEDCIALYHNELKPLRNQSLEILKKNSEPEQILTQEIEAVADRQALLDCPKIKNSAVEGEAAAAEQMN